MAWTRSHLPLLWFTHTNKVRLSSLSIALLALSHLALQAQSNQPKPAIDRIKPPQFGFYAKDINCNGIMIRAGATVQDHSLLQACGDISQMLAHIDIVRQNLMQRGVELHLIANNQTLSTLPEYARVNGNDIQQTVRGIPNLYSVCGEESLSAFPDDTDKEDLCLHEFAVAIMRYGFDAAMRKHITAQFRNAIITGLWQGTDAATSPEQYWAELSLWYFGNHGKFMRPAARFPAPGKQSLRQYDPGGYALLDLLYNDRERPKPIEAIRARSVSNRALSSTGHDPAELQLVNNSPQTLRIFWIDPTGQPRSMGELGPYNRTIKDTSLSQVWMLEDQRGVELDRIIVEDYVSEVVAAD